MKNIIRYFTAIGNQIADMAGSIGAKVYMQKLYNRTKLAFTLSFLLIYILFDIIPNKNSKSRIFSSNIKKA